MNKNQLTPNEAFDYMESLTARQWLDMFVEQDMMPILARDMFLHDHGDKFPLFRVLELCRFAALLMTIPELQRTPDHAAVIEILDRVAVSHGGIVIRAYDDGETA